MPKYRIAETLRVELIIDDETADKAIEQYMKEFLHTFNSEQGIQCMEGSDFTVHKVNDNGSIGEEIDPPNEFPKV